MDSNLKRAAVREFRKWLKMYIRSFTNKVKREAGKDASNKKGN